MGRNLLIGQNCTRCKSSLVDQITIICCNLNNGTVNLCTTHHQLNAEELTDWSDNNLLCLYCTPVYYTPPNTILEGVFGCVQFMTSLCNLIPRPLTQVGGAHKTSCNEYERVYPTLLILSWPLILKVLPSLYTIPVTLWCHIKPASLVNIKLADLLSLNSWLSWSNICYEYWMRRLCTLVVL